MKGKLNMTKDEIEEKLRTICRIIDIIESRQHNWIDYYREPNIHYQYELQELYEEREKLINYKKSLELVKVGNFNHIL